MIDFWKDFPIYFIRFYIGVLFSISVVIISMAPIIIIISFYEDKLIPFLKKRFSIK